jgi:tetratricopeptide (TPR) repeat protein
VNQLGCFSAEELVGAVHGELPEDRAQHLNSCGTCANRLVMLQRVELAGPEVIGDTISEVDALVARLLVIPRDAWWRTLTERDYQRPDLVRRLVALADDASLSDRKMAVAFVAAATRLVDSLSRERDRNDVAELRFETWKFASALLREAGKYDLTEVALATAESAARLVSNPEVAQASVLFSRALLYAEPDVWKPDKAKRLLDQSEAVFVRRDPARKRSVRIARAFLLYRSGDLDAARSAFSEILEATAATDREGYLNALTNLMFARIDLGEQDEDVRGSVELLIAEYTRLGQTVHVARARWLMGKVHRLRGRLDESIDLLRSAMDDIGNRDSAIRVGLDLLETLLLAERYAAAVSLSRELAAEAVALDRSEPSRSRSLTAAVFAYAREAAQRGVLTPDLVSQLARYVDRINRQRVVNFIPPMPLADM